MKIGLVTPILVVRVLDVVEDSTADPHAIFRVELWEELMRVPHLHHRLES